MLHLQKHSNPLRISANTPMTIKPRILFIIFHHHFKSNSVNTEKYKSENKPKKHIKIENQKIKHYPREKSHQVHHYTPVKRKLLLWQRLGEEIGMLVLRRYVDNLYLLPLYRFPQKVMPHVNVLRVRVGNRVLCDLNGTLVILILRSTWQCTAS